jgi:NADPH-dependent 2,4-dienoyl-CoA reductase/sulfur reductase-like enzyme
MSDMVKQEIYDIVVIGAGPAGIAVATGLKKSGIESIIVLDRELDAGGVTRHCGHPPFGILEYQKIMKGPTYAKCLAQTARNCGIKLALNSTVIKLEEGGLLTISTPEEGITTLKAKRVIIATGARETPRSAQLVSGDRAVGVYNTGALQSMVYLKKLVPFHRPVVVGTEVVSFSALLTCRKAKIKPVALLRESTASGGLIWPFYYAAILFGVPLRLSTDVTKIIGKNRIEAVEVIDKNGKKSKIECDGILFTGKFIPEVSLTRNSHLKINPKTGQPLVDKSGRCSDPAYYAVGNIINKKANISWKCWLKGRRLVKHILKDM